MGDVALTLAMRPVTLCFQGLAAALMGKCMGLQMTSSLIQRTEADLDYVDTAEAPVNIVCRLMVAKVDAGVGRALRRPPLPLHQLPRLQP
jgi:hypothetical protein